MKGLTEINLVRSSHPDVPRNRCSENMQQIYRRTTMQKCDFNKVAKQLYWNHTSAGLFSCKFAAYFQNSFFIKHLWVAASALLFYDFECLMFNIIKLQNKLSLNRLNRFSLKWAFSIGLVLAVEKGWRFCTKRVFSHRSKFPTYSLAPLQNRNYPDSFSSSKWNFCLHVTIHRSSQWSHKLQWVLDLLLNR